MVRDVQSVSRRERKKALDPRICVTLDGRDVTTQVYRADTRLGIVWGFRHSEQGFPLIHPKTGELWREVRHGRVRITYRRFHGE